MERYILNENDHKISKKNVYLVRKKLFDLRPFDAVIFNLSMVDCFLCSYEILKLSNLISMTLMLGNCYSRTSSALELTSPLRTVSKRYVKNLPFFEVEFIRVYSNNIFWKSLI